MGRRRNNCKWLNNRRHFESRNRRVSRASSWVKNKSHSSASRARAHRDSNKAKQSETYIKPKRYQLININHISKVRLGLTWSYKANYQRRVAIWATQRILNICTSSVARISTEVSLTTSGASTCINFKLKINSKWSSGRNSKPKVNLLRTRPTAACLFTKAKFTSLVEWRSNYPFSEGSKGAQNLRQILMGRWRPEAVKVYSLSHWVYRIYNGFRCVRMKKYPRSTTLPISLTQNITTCTSSAATWTVTSQTYFSRSTWRQSVSKFFHLTSRIIPSSLA